MQEKLEIPSMPNVRGLLKLELVHPRTGKVLKSVKAENAVSDLWEYIVRAYAVNLFLSGNPATIATNQTPPSAGFNYVCLWDSAANPGSIGLSGTMTAWADKSTYSGASIRRGSLIAAGCSVSRTDATYVWEWPTTAGNGLVKSVGFVDWCNDIGPSALIYQRRVRKDSPVLYGIPNTAASMYDHTNNICWYISGTDVLGAPFSVQDPDIIGLEWPVVEASDRTIPRANIGFGSATLNGVTSDGSSLYVVANTGEIKKFAVPGTGTVDPTESALTVPSRTALNKITYDGTYLWVSEGSVVYRVNKTTGAIERSFSVAGAPAGIWWHEQRNFLICAIGAAVYGYDLDGNVVLYYYPWRNDGAYIAAENGGAYPQNQFQQWTYLGNNLNYTRTSSGSYSGHWIQEMNAASRTVLGAEVEKTSLTGMKLTYTLNFS